MEAFASYAGFSEPFSLMVTRIDLMAGPDGTLSP